MDDEVNEHASAVEVVRAMREALDILKAKWQEAEGAWAVTDFLGCALNEDHWMHAILRAETLSDQFLSKPEGEVT